MRMWIDGEIDARIEAVERWRSIGGKMKDICKRKKDILLLLLLL